MEYDHRKWKARKALRARIAALREQQNSETVQFNRVWDSRLEELRRRIDGQRTEKPARPRPRTAVARRAKLAHSAPLPRRSGSVVEGIL
jgi:hypothetical protein